MPVPGRETVGRLVNRVRSRFASRGLILMYHRIAQLDSDPWGLAVSPAHFAEHLSVLRNSASAISLERLGRDLDGGEVFRRSVVLTFDDGYADNVETARPLLEAHEIPATIFLTTGAIGSDREFWWDELDRVLLEPRTLPLALELRRPEWSRRYELGADAAYGDSAYRHNRSWRAWEHPPTRRHAIYCELWQRLFGLPFAEKRVLLGELLGWAGLEPLMRDTHRLVSVDQVRQLSRHPLIEIGAHTVTHPPLTTLPVDARRQEIAQSRRFLEDLLNRSVECFAYPHGQHDPETVSAVREAGFASACTTVGSAVSRRSDRLALPRFQVLDWDGAEFRDRLQTWRVAAQR